MIVGKRMSTPVITVEHDASLPDAFNMMKKENIRRLVVVNKGNMVGLVTKRDLEKASPSQATSLSIWELNYLLDKLKVEDVMIKEVLTTTEDTPIEEAARIMADYKISCLPVLRGEDVIGIITATDLFMVFLEVMGARQNGIRLSAEISVEPGSIARLTQAIYEAGGDIIAFGTFLGDAISKDEVTIKVQGIGLDELRKAVEPHILNLMSIREV